MAEPFSIHLIGAPSSAGAYAPGQEQAPAAYRRHGLIEALRRQGVRVTDRGNGPLFRWQPDPGNTQAMNEAQVARAAQAVAGNVAAVPAGEFALVLGGDCTVELGTVAGALEHGPSVGLVYIDFDADLNPPADSDGALDWTGVAHLLDLPGTRPLLSHLGPRRPLLSARDVLFFGVENLTAGERQTIDRLSLATISRAEVREDAEAAAQRAAAWAGNFKQVLIHLDLDVLEYIHFPIAENVRREPGLRLEDLAPVLRRLVRLPACRALTITEANPEHAPDEAEIMGRLVAFIAGIFREGH